VLTNHVSSIINKTLVNQLVLLFGQEVLVEISFRYLSENSPLRNVITGEEEMESNQFSDHFIVKTISEVKSCFQRFMIIVTWYRKIKRKQILAKKLKKKKLSFNC